MALPPSSGRPTRSASCATNSNGRRSSHRGQKTRPSHLWAKVRPRVDLRSCRGTRWKTGREPSCPDRDVTPPRPAHQQPRPSPAFQRALVHRRRPTPGASFPVRNLGRRHAQGLLLPNHRRGPRSRWRQPKAKSRGLRRQVVLDRQQQLAARIVMVAGHQPHDLGRFQGIGQLAVGDAPLGRGVQPRQAHDRGLRASGQLGELIQKHADVESRGRKAEFTHPGVEVVDHGQAAIAGVHDGRSQSVQPARRAAARFCLREGRPGA